MTLAAIDGLPTIRGYDTRRPLIPYPTQVAGCHNNDELTIIAQKVGVILLATKIH